MLDGSKPVTEFGRDDLNVARLARIDDAFQVLFVVVNDEPDPQDDEVRPQVAGEASTVSIRSHMHGRWQTAVDVLMAGVAGALIYSQHDSRRRERGYELPPRCG